MAIIVLPTILSVIQTVITIGVAVMVAIVLHHFKILFDDVDSYYRKRNQRFSDNGMNMDFIQKSLDTLTQAGYDPEITMDNDGHRWISVEVEKFNTVNVLRLDEGNFGRDAKWADVEATLQNAIEKVIPEIKAEIEKENSKKENA